MHFLPCKHSTLIIALPRHPQTTLELCSKVSLHKELAAAAFSKRNFFHRTPSTLKDKVNEFARSSLHQDCSPFAGFVQYLRHDFETWTRVTRHHNPNTFIMFASDHSSQRLTLEALPHLVVFLAHLFKEWEARPTRFEKSVIPLRKTRPWFKCWFSFALSDSLGHKVSVAASRQAWSPRSCPPIMYKP